MHVFMIVCVIVCVWGAIWCQYCCVDDTLYLIVDGYTWELCYSNLPEIVVLAEIQMNAFVFVLVQVNLPPKNKPELTQTNSTFIFSLHFSYFKYNLFCLARAISRDVLPQIKHLLDENLLYEYLMEYGIVRSGEDMELITSSYYKPEDRISSLFDIVEREGSKGAAAFITALEKSGHQEALVIIKQHGEWNSFVEALIFSFWDEKKSSDLPWV